MLAITGSPGGGVGRALSFDFFPDLAKVVRGHEPSDSRIVAWGGKCTRFPARKASVTVGNVAKLSTGYWGKLSHCFYSLVTT